MLLKTLRMLDGLKPGTFLSEDTTCFDEQEIHELGVLLQKLLYSPSEVRKRLQAYGVNLVPSSFYSEVPTIEEIEDSFRPERLVKYESIFDNKIILNNLSDLAKFSSEFDAPHKEAEPGMFFWENSQFSYSDAMSYYCMIRSKHPRHIVEIGSGYSTLVALMATRKNGFGEITCIEPYPRDFLKTLGVNLIEKKVQSVAIDFFNSVLTEDGDFLFVDSTHTVKHGSDCLDIYLKIIPSISRECFIHAHDIFLPRSFSKEQLRDEQIYWTEQYLLYAYLLENRRTEVIYSSSYADMEMKGLLDAFMAGKYGSGGGSLWFRQKAPVAQLG